MLSKQIYDRTPYLQVQPLNRSQATTVFMKKASDHIEHGSTNVVQYLQLKEKRKVIELNQLECIRTCVEDYLIRGVNVCCCWDIYLTWNARLHTCDTIFYNQRPNGFARCWFSRGFWSRIQNNKNCEEYWICDIVIVEQYQRRNHKIRNQNEKLVLSQVLNWDLLTTIYF